MKCAIKLWYIRHLWMGAATFFIWWIEKKRISEFSVYATLNSAIIIINGRGLREERWGTNWAKTYYSVIFMRNSHFVDSFYSFTSSHLIGRIVYTKLKLSRDGGCDQTRRWVNIVIRTAEKFNGFIGRDGIIQIVCSHSDFNCVFLHFFLHLHKCMQHVWSLSGFYNRKMGSGIITHAKIKNQSSKWPKWAWN